MRLAIVSRDDIQAMIGAPNHLDRQGSLMKDYYEDLWAELPDELKPPDWGLRRRFLEAGLRPGDSVLDLGCGDGAFTAVMAAAGADPVGAEVADVALARARERHPELDFRLVAIEGPLPFQDALFDVVWASEVIEHVADTARWLSEVRRVLKPGGHLLVTTPSHGRLRLALAGIERLAPPLGDHLHLYTRSALRSLLEELGFGEVRVRAAAGPPLLRRLLLAEGVR
jgi:SAM-dependent methyltransferase